MKWSWSLRFFLSFPTNDWPGVAIFTLYWLPQSSKQDLMRMYVIAIFTQVVFSFFL